MQEYKRRFMGMQITASRSPSSPGGVRVVVKPPIGRDYTMDVPQVDAQWIADTLAALGIRGK